MVRSEKNMYEKLGFKESSNRYGADNGLGYWGRYQMGEAALTDAGYMKNGRFTGKDGIYSAADFKNNPNSITKSPCAILVDVNGGKSQPLQT